MSDAKIKCDECGDMQSILISPNKDLNICPLCFAENIIKENRDSKPYSDIKIYPDIYIADITALRNRREQRPDYYKNY